MLRHHSNVSMFQRENIMSQHDIESAYTPEEQAENSRVDALAIFSILVITLGILIFFVAS